MCATLWVALIVLPFPWLLLVCYVLCSPPHFSGFTSAGSFIYTRGTRTDTEVRTS